MSASDMAALRAQIQALSEQRRIDKVKETLRADYEQQRTMDRLLRQIELKDAVTAMQRKIDKKDAAQHRIAYLLGQERAERKALEARLAMQRELDVTRAEQKELQHKSDHLQRAAAGLQQATLRKPEQIPKVQTIQRHQVLNSFIKHIYIYM